MSGGVDSAVTASLLQKAGYEVIGLTLTLWEDEGEEEKAWQDRSCCKVGLARHVAKQLAIPHYSLNVRKIFQDEVIDPFCDTYLEGKTPNPCVLCNARVKFSQLLAAGERLRVDYIATGHYGRIQYQSEGGRYILLKGSHPEKDQSYFLYRLSQDQLSQTLFPLGEMSKEMVYKIAGELGLPYEEILESQEVCFVTQKDYRGFLSEARPESRAPGEIILETGEVVGQHEGIAFHTIGQRRGLGVALGERAYVTRLDPENKKVVLGSEEELRSQELLVRNIIWGGRGLPTDPTRISAKIRYQTPEGQAILTPVSEGRARVIFDEPQRGIAPGQSVVFYQGDEVLGGGTIQ
jgi:tRNA-uridine 2-sulfurtransferase